MYKKKSLKFTYENVSRDIRQAEAFKARETSRFKRLSIARSLMHSDLLEKSMEMPKESKFKAPEAQKPSRLEMLFKWKQEKQVKKEMEKISKKKPFYTGGNKNVIENKTLQSFKSSFIAQTNSSFNSSKFMKSKLVTPNTTVQPSRIQNSRQVTPSLRIQSSKIPNSKQGAASSTFQSPRNVISKQFTAGTSQSSKIPNSKQITLPKSSTNLSRSNSTATFSRKFPASAVDKTSISAKPSVSLTRSNSKAAVPKKFPVPSSKLEKAVSSKPTIQKASFVKRTPHVEISGNAVKLKDLSKPVNKVGIGLPKLKSNVTTVSKGIPIQNKEVSQTNENVSSRKGYCFRTAVQNSSRQKSDILLKTSKQDTPKKLSKNIEEKPSTKEFYEQSLDSVPDVTFNSDISIIKPARTSFAPANFTFQPPEGLNNFIFDDDYDVYQDLEEVKLKFMSRTSTPSKNSGRKSSIKSSKGSLGSNKPIADVEKTSDLSNSNDICISELMTPNSFEVKIKKKEADELVNKQTSNEVVCDVISNLEIKNANIVYQQTCVKETVDQETDEQSVSVSHVKTEYKDDKTIYQQTSQEITSDITTDRNQKAHEELTSISPVKVVITAASPAVDSGLQMCLFSEKQSFDDSDMTDNPKENTVEISNNEKHINHSFKNGTPEKTAENSVFLNNDDSLLDSIDLSKMMMRSDDEDSDEDNVPSPQIPKCSERKSNGTIPKRISMLKKLSVMNSIAETNETECVVNAAKSSKSHNTKTTPQHSKRVSKLVSVDTFGYTPVKNSANSPTTTPRRSLRLMKISSASDNYPVSPFQEKTANVNSRRRSVRLIDLNTPEKVACEKLIGENFENLDPNNFLIDFESPIMPAVPKSKKVSLLYSPERRKSIRKSIKGDLISFSPI